MSTQLQDRINILNRLNANPFKKNENQSQKWFTNYTILIILGILYLISTVFVFLHVTSAYFEQPNFHWSNSAKYVLCSLMSLVLIKYGLLINHIMLHRQWLVRLENIPQLDIQEENEELRQLIKPINNRLQRSWFTIAIIVLAMVQVFFEHRFPYWNYLKVPVLFSIIFESIDYISLKRKFQTNFESVATKKG